MSSPQPTSGVVNSPSNTLTNLWDEAAQLLKQKDKDSLQSKGNGNVENLLELVKSHQKDSEDKSLKAKRSNGEVIVFREVFAKIALWVQKVVDVGDVAVQFDPVHAVLPWAALRFILKVCISDYENRAILLEGVEEIVRIITRSTIHGKLYLSHVYEATDQLKKHLISLYTLILSFLAKTVRFYDRGPINRAMKSFSPSSCKYQALILRINKQQTEVERCSQLIRKETEDERYNEAHQFQNGVELELKDLDASVHRIENLNTNIHAMLKDQERENVLRWISDIKYAKFHAAAYSKIMKDTGMWLCEHDTFKSWKNSSACQILWLHGIPGSGKTSLTSILIQTMMDDHQKLKTVRPIHFYCARNPSEPYRSNPNSILRCLLRQLLKSGAPQGVLDQIQQRYENRDDEPDFSLKETEDLLLEIIRSRSATFVFIDALDECDAEQRRELTKSIQRLLRDASGLLKIFISSREDQDIVARLNDYPNLDIKASDNKDDIQHFVHKEVQDRIEDKSLLPTLEVPQLLEDEIKQALCQNAQAMFRWVELQLQFLCTLNTVEEVQARLSSLPPTLGEIYEDIYSRGIDSLTANEKSIAVTILGWLFCCARPLTPSELSAFTKSQEGEQPIFSALTAAQILKFTCNLVILDRELDVFRFAHLSVREYLEGRQNEYLSNEINEMAAIKCLKVLLRENVDTHDAYDYSSYFWPQHCVKSNTNRFNEQLRTLLFDFMIEDQEAFIRWFEYHKKVTDERYSSGPKYNKFMHRERQDISSPLFAACKLGFIEIVRAWLRSGKQMEKMYDRDGATPQYVASSQGFPDIVLELAAAGFDLNEEGGEAGNALVVASGAGHKEVVEALLDSGADCNCSTVAGSALDQASWGGQKAVVQFLLDRGADPELEEYGAIPALSAACEAGHKEVAQLLIERGANIHRANKWDETPLEIAYENGHRDVVELLLSYGAKDNLEENGAGSKGFEETIVQDDQEASILPVREATGSIPFQETA